jgi:hypothetical protein
MAHRRTGLREPKNYLKVWSPVSARDWTRKDLKESVSGDDLSPRLHVGRVDEELPFGKEGGRKSWYLLLTQSPDILTILDPVHGAPGEGVSMLLFEDDVVALCRYLLESCHHVPSLLPRRSASVHRLSTFPRRIAFAYFVEARPPHSLTRLRLGSLRATARSFAAVGLPADNILAPLLLDTSRRHAGSRATLSLSAYRGGLLSSHKERAAFTAHTK